MPLLAFSASRITAIPLSQEVFYAKAATATAVQESDDLRDAITADLFTQLTRELDKVRWFLEAHLTQS